MRALVLVLALVLGVSAKSRIEVVKVVKADTIVTVKMDTVRTIRYDTLAITKTIQDTAILMKVDTVLVQPKKKK